jgi:hypothetical protein
MSEDIKYGELPIGNTAMAACDSEYFMKFAPAFIESVTHHGCCNVHVHVANPTDEVFALASFLASSSSLKTTFTFSEHEWLNEKTDEERRAFYAALRFLVAPWILQTAGRLMILDIDSIAMTRIPFNSNDDLIIGYYPRESLPGTVGWEAEGTKVAAGAVYLHKDAQDVANAIADVLQKLPLRWFNDQIALSKVIEQIPEKHRWTFDSKMLDWDFSIGSVIWTGKGNRKYENESYVSVQNGLTQRIMKRVNDCDVIMFAPRLDIPFKKMDLVLEGQTREPIRTHWHNFANIKIMDAKKAFALLAPRWMFNEKVLQYLPKDALKFVPHVERKEWGGDENTWFYMQTVFPWLFTADIDGWAGGAKYIETYDPNRPVDSTTYESMKTILGEGKFGHLQSNTVPWDLIDDEYIIVPLQLPHDETIKYHSDFSVEHFVEQLCKMAKENPEMPQLVFKGHPINLASMEPLKKIIEDNGQLYIANANFNELVKKATAMFVLNGGSGQEAMLHGIPVATFGRCDYSMAVVNGDIENPYEAWKAIEDLDHAEMMDNYYRWFDWYVNDICIDASGASVAERVELKKAQDGVS